MGIPPDVRAAVVSSYYPRALAIPDAARARAQAGYAIAAAIAAAVVAAGVFGDLEDQVVAVQILGVASLVAWLAAAGFFLVAVSRPFVPAQPPALTGADAFIQSVLDAVKSERRKVDAWQTAASIVSGIAAALTVSALVVALVVDAPSASRAATIRVAHRAASSVGFLCGVPHSKLKVSLDPAALKQPFVSVHLQAGQCGPAELDMSIPRGQVLAVAFSGH